MTVQIENGSIQLSPQDRGLLKEHKWYISGDGYIRNCDGETLHSYIREAEYPLVVDHKNRDRNDNMRRNLRIVTRYQNLMNSDYGDSLRFNHNQFLED